MNGKGGSRSRGTALGCGDRAWTKCILSGVSMPSEGTAMLARNCGKAVLRTLSWSLQEYLSNLYRFQVSVSSHLNSTENGVG